MDRDVAVKILPESVAADPDMLARFEREAKAVAALSHPNILSACRLTHRRLRGLAARCARGDRRRLHVLARAEEEHQGLLCYTGLPGFDSLRADPRFGALLERQGLPARATGTRP